jgi:hypothetical protein
MKKKLLLLVTVPAAFLVIVVLIAVFTARSGSPGSGTATRSLAEPQDGGAVQPSAERATDGVVGRTGKGAVTTSPIAPMTRAVVSTGEVSLHPESMGRARAEVLRLVASWGGTVAEEQTSSDRGGVIVESTMTVRVPTPKFDEAMDAFARLGKVEHQSRSSEDVTTAVIDNDARVRAAERSIRQIENLLSRAEKLGDIIAIESDLARRQADLDSLKSQQAYLSDQTSLSTVNVHLSRVGAARPEPREAQGFLAGLDNGWSAMKGATVVLLTVVGALLPFALLLLLVLGVPLWLVVRRRGGVSGASAPARSA